MKLPDNTTTDFWIQQKKNALLIGEKGTGKSTVMMEAFNRNFGKLDEDWLYFSAATLDPFIDLVGIPKEKIDKSGNSFIQLVRPEYFRKAAKIRGIIFDEINRCNPKVSNAMLEMIQFKSVNGFKFENLEVIWAAANPYDEENRYAVEKMDEALEDRFHVIYNVDYKISEDFFIAKYGEPLARPAIEWWKQLTDEIKLLCSPRRLDYALQMFIEGGNLRHVLHEKTNVSKLADLLNNGSIESRLKSAFTKPAAQVKKIFMSANILEDTPPHLHANPEFFNKFVPIIAEVNAEFVAKLLNHKNVSQFVQLALEHDNIKAVLLNVTQVGHADGDLLNRLSTEMQKFFPKDVTIDPNTSSFVPSSPNSPVFVASKSPAGTGAAAKQAIPGPFFGGSGGGGGTGGSVHPVQVDNRSNRSDIQVSLHP